MRPLLVSVILLAGCATPRPPLPTQPAGPTTESVVASVGKSWDTADQKVAAAVSIARENATLPAIVTAETTVALSYLPPVSEPELALARARALAGSPKAYAAASAFGAKLLASITSDWDRVESDQREAARISALKDARIVELLSDIERIKRESSRNIWSLTGAALAIAGALASAFLGPRIGIPILLCGGFCGCLPFIVDSPHFILIAAVTVALASGLGLWRLWDYVRDLNHARHVSKKD